MKLGRIKTQLILLHREISPAPSFPKRGTYYKRYLEGSPFGKRGPGGFEVVS